MVIEIVYHFQSLEIPSVRRAGTSHFVPLSSVVVTAAGDGEMSLCVSRGPSTKQSELFFTIYMRNFCFDIALIGAHAIWIVWRIANISKMIDESVIHSNFEWRSSSLFLHLLYLYVHTSDSCEKSVPYIKWTLYCHIVYGWCFVNSMSNGYKTIWFDGLVFLLSWCYKS